MFAYYYNERLKARDCGMLCPESPTRYQMIQPDLVLKDRAAQYTRSFEAKGEMIISLAHSEEHLSFVREAYQNKVRFLDSGDTRVTEDTFESALLSASAACVAADALAAGQITRAFCATRPPGHHANDSRSMGFCVFNNVAIAARYLQKYCNFAKVLIIDWDVHPGNGTQEIFWQDPSVFVFSIHQANHFPASGGSERIGDGDGKGFNRNIPVEPGTPREQFMGVFETQLNYVLRDFCPDMVLISAGFDAHKQDPASQLGIEASDYRLMTQTILKLIDRYTQGRLISLLEGGYNPAALQACVQEHCLALIN